MEKSIHTRDYAMALQLLRESREAAGLTQVAVAKKLRLTQSLYSKMERGECRLDIIQLRKVCQVIGLTLPQFVAQLEARLTAHK